MFLIAGGLPRSGTTTFRRMCNIHPDIFLATEMPIYDIQCHLLDCLRGLQAAMKKRGALENFREREERFVKEMLFAANRHDGNLAKVRRRFDNARIFGHKTPTSELTFAALEELLGHHEPHYVYCLRDPVDCLNSRVRMPWKVMSFDALLEKMRESYRAFLTAWERHPDRLFLFRIDEYAANPEDVAGRLCDFLGLDRKPLEKMASLTKPNSSAKLAVRDQLRDRELSAEEIEQIRSDPLVKQVTEQFGWSG